MVCDFGAMDGSSRSFPMCPSTQQAVDLCHLIEFEQKRHVNNFGGTAMMTVHDC